MVIIMIIELFGLPGSGKSTICQKIAQKNDIINIMDKYLNSVTGKIKMHLFWKFFILNKNLRVKYNEMHELVKRNSNNIFNSQIGIDKYLKFMLFAYHIGNINKEKNVIFDEGIAHYCLALNAEFDVDITILQRLSVIMETNNRMSIGVNVDIDTVKKQIKSRDRHATMIDELEGQKLDMLLHRYQVGYEMLIQNYDSFDRDNLINEVQKRLEYRRMENEI